MKIPAFKAPAFTALLLSLAIADAAYAQTLTVSVEPTAGTGTVYAAVYDSQQGFEAGKTAAILRVPAQNGVTGLVFEDLKAGTYGITLFLDQNENGVLDRNVFGMPTEAFGFSNNPKIGFSAPKFDALQFDFDGSALALPVTLNGG